jgi:hypothetical protein
LSSQVVQLRSVSTFRPQYQSEQGHQKDLQVKERLPIQIVPALKLHHVEVKIEKEQIVEDGLHSCRPFHGVF